MNGPRSRQHHHALGLELVGRAHPDEGAFDVVARGVCGEIHVHRPESRKAAGLDRQTKFILTRTAIVPFRFAFFRADRFSSVVLGHLHEHDRTAAGRMLAASRRRDERD